MRRVDKNQMQYPVDSHSIYLWQRASATSRALGATLWRLSVIWSSRASAAFPTRLILPASEIVTPVRARKSSPVFSIELPASLFSSWFLVAKNYPFYSNMRFLADSISLANGLIGVRFRATRRQKPDAVSGRFKFYIRYWMNMLELNKAKYT